MFTTIISVVLLIATAFAGPVPCSAEAGCNGDGSTVAQQFYLSVYTPGQQAFTPEYLTAEGAIVSTVASATEFQLTTLGSLATVSMPDDFAVRHLSTDGAQSSEPFEMGLALKQIYTGFELVSKPEGNILVWHGEGWNDGYAHFCTLGQGTLGDVQIVFKGNDPEDCNRVELVAVTQV